MFTRINRGKSLQTLTGHTDLLEFLQADNKGGN